MNFIFRFQQSANDFSRYCDRSLFDIQIKTWAEHQRMKLGSRFGRNAIEELLTLEGGRDLDAAKKMDEQRGSLPPHAA